LQIYSFGGGTEYIADRLFASPPAEERAAIEVAAHTKAQLWAGSGSLAQTRFEIERACRGIGTLIVETLARQIKATVAKERSTTGYEVTVTVPHR
jgi:two-component sensor histidine kinase